MKHTKMLKHSVKPIDINFQDLKYSVHVQKQKEKKFVLKGINGTFKSGQLTAIMGPSGAGKSCLMNILTGFVVDGVDGTIHFGNNLHNAQKNCCYIMQDDFFYTWFTVEETMMLAATLKISNKSMNIKEKKLLIEHLLETLKLKQTKQTKCGSLSGGQKKRLSIALELIDNPAVLFLDEPTTGLDSSSSYDTVHLLQVLAAEGRTIVCTIHQPSTNIFNLFDRIYVMSQGHCTYEGTPYNTVAFLKTVGLGCPAYHNPADFLLECVNGEYGDYTDALALAAKDARWCSNDHNVNLNQTQMAKMVEANSLATTTTTTRAAAEKNVNGINEASADASLAHYDTTMKTSHHIYPPPEWVRLWLLIGRCHVQFFRDWTVTYLKLAVHVFCGVLLGLLFSDSGKNASKQVSNVGSFMVHIIYLWYTTIMPGVLRFPQEIQIIKKETFNNWYKLRTYYLATLITSTPVHIMFSTVYVTILYLMTEQPMEIERYVKFLLAAVFVTICADGMGIFLGTILNPINGTFVAAILTCFMLIFSGFLIFLSHMSKLMHIVAYLSPLRFGLESMILSIYADQRESLACPESELFCYFKNPTTILRVFGMEDGSYSFDILMIIAQIAVFKILAYFTLKHKLRSLV